MFDQCCIVINVCERGSEFYDAVLVLSHCVTLNCPQGGRYGHIVKGMSRGLEICNIYTAIRFELNTLGWMDLNTLTLNALLHNVTEHFKLTQPRPSFFMNL